MDSLNEDVQGCIQKWVILFDETEARAYWISLRPNEPVPTKSKRIAKTKPLQWHMMVSCMYYDGYLRRERIAPTMENIMSFREFMFLERFSNGVIYSFSG